MKNPLRKRFFRELREEIGKYLVVFILMAATIGFVSGFLVADGSMLTAYNNSFQKYNIEDGKFETEATHKTAQGDDVMLEIGVGETNYYKLYGGSEITTETRGYNSAHVSEIAPTTPINGMLWYDTKIGGGMKMYNANSSSWISLKN